MKNLKKFLPYISVFIILIAGISILFFGNINNGKGSVPIRTGTESFSVDVCINQDCDYPAGGANDQVQIQQAIDAVLAVGGGKVNIRNGDYSIEAPINISLSGESLIIEGDGANTKLTNAMTDGSELGSMFIANGMAASLLDTPTGFSVATSTAGSLTAGTYYFKLAAYDDAGAMSQGTSEASCVIGNELTSTSTQCVVSWTAVTGATGYRVWARTSGSFTDYFLATTTTSYYFATSTAGLVIPQDVAVASSTSGSLLAGTYHVRVSAIDADGEETLATTEVGCLVGFELTSTSSHCMITWTDSVSATSHRVYVSSFSGNYTGYFAATTTNQYALATTTSIVTGTLPTENNTTLSTDPISGTLETILLDSFTMKNIYLVGNSTGGKGLITKDINQTSILSSKFTDFTTSATWGIGISASSSGQTLIDNCIFEDNTEDIELMGKTSNTFINNNIFNDDGEITIGSGTSDIIIINNSNLSTITDNGGTNISINNDGNIGVGTPNPQQGFTLGNDDSFAIEIDTPTITAAAIVSSTTAGSLIDVEYFVKITALDGLGGQTIPTTEDSCTGVLDDDAAVATSTVCDITWTAADKAASHRVWVATTTDVYYGYFVATTTGEFSLTATSSLVAGTMPTVSTAYVTRITPGLADVGTFTQGGGVNSTSTPASMTLSESDFDTENSIEMLLTVGAATITLPASSTLSDFIPDPGDSRQVIIYNASSTAGINITLAEGTGTGFSNASSSLAITPQGHAIINFLRLVSTDISAIINIFD